MDLIKAKSILARLQAMINTLEANPELSALERDLILNYLRELYELVNDIRPHSLPVIKSKAEPTSTTPEKEAVQKILEFKFEPIEDLPAEKPAIPAEKPDTPPPVAQPEPAPVQPAVVEEIKPVTEPVKPNTETIPSAVKTNPIPASILELFEVRKGSELSDKLNELPLRDINRAIGIADRMEIIQTLFGGQRQLFDQIVTDLNQLKSYEEAREFLGPGPAIHYKWDHDDRREKAVEFIRLIRRRYL